VTDAALLVDDAFNDSYRTSAPDTCESEPPSTAQFGPRERCRFPSV